MARKKSSDNGNKLHFLLVVGFFITTLLFAVLFYNANSALTTSNELINSQKATIADLELLSEDKGTLAADLAEKESVLEEIKTFQQAANSQSRRAEAIGLNLVDYQTDWSNSAVGSAAEERALSRYKEELDEFKVIIEENNELLLLHRDVLSNYLLVDVDEEIANNLLAYDVYEDEYYDMLNYEE